MQGLLDFIKTPEGQGLLSAAFGGMAGAQRGTPWNNAGRAGLAGVMGYTNAQDRQTEQAQLAKRNQMYDLQLAQAKRENDTAEGIRKAGLESMRNPAQMALANGQGPTIANAEAIETTKPGFDTEGFMNRVMGIDPLKGIALQQSMAKETPFNKLDAKDYTQESIAKFAQSRNYGDLVPVRKMEVAGSGQVYNPYTIQPGTVMADPNKPFTIGQNGQFVPNMPYQNYEITKSRAGASNTNVRVDAGPKAFWQDFGKSASEQLFQERDSAKAAAGTLQSVGEIRKAAAGGAYQGAGAEMKLNAAKALGALGMPYDAKTVANSELFNAQANQFVLNSIKGLGANPSNADREFIEKTVPRLSTDPKALPELLNFIETKARGQIGAYNSKIKGVQQQAEGGFIPYSLEVPVPEVQPAQQPKQQSFDMLPPASGFAGKRMRAPDGTIYKSDGNRWIKG